MIQRRHASTALLALALTSLVACSSKDEEEEADSAGAAAVQPPSNEDYAARQQSFVDSLIKTTPTPQQLAVSLGAGYVAAPAELADSVTARIAKSDCFDKGREIDPYLGGTIHVMAHVSVIGVDNAYVQDSKWSSAAGNIVNSCLNGQAKSWKLGRLAPMNFAYLVRYDFKAKPPATLTDSVSVKKGSTKS